MRIISIQFSNNNLACVGTSAAGWKWVKVSIRHRDKLHKLYQQRISVELADLRHIKVCTLNSSYEIGNG